MKGRKASIREIRENMKDNASLRRSVFQGLCKHLEQGFSIESYGVLSEESIKKYMEVYKEEFVKEEFEDSLCKGRLMWESIGKEQARGTCLGNSRTWFYNMSQRYGWSERSKIETDNKHNVNVSVVSYASKKGSTSTSEQA